MIPVSLVSYICMNSFWFGFGEGKGLPVLVHSMCEDRSVPPSSNPSHRKVCGEPTRPRAVCIWLAQTKARRQEIRAAILSLLCFSLSILGQRFCSNGVCTYVFVLREETQDEKRAELMLLNG